MTDTKGELLGFVFDHVDNCAQCCSGWHCAEGKRLIAHAAEIAVAMSAVPIPRTKTQN